MQVDAGLALFLTKEKNFFWGLANQQCLYTLKPIKVQRGKELKRHFKCDPGIKPAITRNIHSWHAFLIILSAKWQGKQGKENAALDLIIAYKKEFVVKVWVLDLGKNKMVLHGILWQSKRKAGHSQQCIRWQVYLWLFLLQNRCSLQRNAENVENYQGKNDVVT